MLLKVISLIGKVSLENPAGNFLSLKIPPPPGSPKYFLFSRIIDVSSRMQVYGVLADGDNLMLDKDPPTLSHFNALPYGLSKFYISLFSRELSRKVDEGKTKVYSLW